PLPEPTPRPPSSPLSPYTTLFRSRAKVPAFAGTSGSGCHQCPRQRGQTERAHERHVVIAPFRLRTQHVERAEAFARAHQRHVHRSEEQRLNSSHSQISYAVFCLKK